MKALFVFSAASATSPEGTAWLESLDALRSHGVEPYAVLPEDGDGTLIGALKARKAKIYVRYFTSWVAPSDQAITSKAKAFRFATNRANKTSEKDIRAILKEQGIHLVCICDGSINAGAIAAKKEGVPVIWQFNSLIGGPDSEVSFIDSDDKVAQSLGLASVLVAADEGIAEALRARCPKANICVIGSRGKEGGQMLFDTMRSVMAQANSVVI